MIPEFDEDTASPEHWLACWKAWSGLSLVQKSKPGVSGYMRRLVASPLADLDVLVDEPALPPSAYTSFVKNQMFPLWLAARPQDCHRLLLGAFPYVKVWAAFALEGILQTWGPSAFSDRMVSAANDLGELDIDLASRIETYLQKFSGGDANMIIFVNDLFVDARGGHRNNSESFRRQYMAYEALVRVLGMRYQHDPFDFMRGRS